jgi:hypothetical protein
MEDDSELSVNESVAETNKEKSNKDLNFERLRKKAEALEKENEETKERLAQQQEMLERFQTAFNPSKSAQEEFDFLTNEEQERLVRMIEQRLEPKIEQRILGNLKARESERFHDRLIDKYSDYDSVVTSDAVDELQKEDPWFSKLAADKANAPEGKYLVGEAIYHKLKDKRNKKPIAPSPMEDRLKRNKSAGILSAISQASFGMPNAYDFDVNDSEARERAWQAVKKAQRSGSYR